jgi:hypothetical protein
MKLLTTLNRGYLLRSRWRMRVIGKAGEGQDVTFGSPLGLLYLSSMNIYTAYVHSEFRIKDVVQSNLTTTNLLKCYYKP